MPAPPPTPEGEDNSLATKVAIVRNSDNRVIDIVASSGGVYTDFYSQPVTEIPLTSGESCELYWIYDQFNNPRFYSDATSYEDSIIVPITVIPGSLAIGNNPGISNRGYNIQFPDGTTQDSAVNRTRLTTFTALQEFAAGISSGQIVTIDPVDGIGLITAKGVAGSPTRIGAIRLGYSESTANYNTVLQNSSGIFTIYNGFSSTGSNLLNINSSVMNVNVPVSGMTFTGNVVGPNIVNSVNGLTGAVSISGGGSGFTYTSSAPGTPSLGDRWMDSDTGKEYVYVNDGSSSQWIEPVSSNGLVGVTYTSSIQLLEFGVTGSFVKLGVGTTAPNYPLDVNGTANFRSGISAADITVNGNTTITGSLNGAGATFTGAVISDGGYRISSSAINAQTGTIYTLLTSDNGKIITMNNGSSSTITIPSGLPVGYNTTVVQLGTGQVGFTSSGTTINSAEGKLNLAFRYSAANIISYTSNTFVVAGGMTG